LKVTLCENGGTSMVYVLFHSTLILTFALTLSQGLNRIFVEGRLVSISENNNNSRAKINLPPFTKFTTS
jgi:hypothetical protein